MEASLMIDELIAMSIDAGAGILEVYERMSPEDVKIKGDGSPVTQADASAELLILARLGRLAPDIPVVAEEAVAGGTVPETHGRHFFLVDPLDGTKEFLSKNGDFTVNIALIENNVPVLGVVYAPALAEIYVGGAHEPARFAKTRHGKAVDWQPIHVRNYAGTAPKVIASRSHLSDETKAFIDRFPGATFVSAGSSLKFCRVATGDADLYPRLARTMEWDIAAGDAVLRAAGGTVTDLDGSPMRYGKRNQSTDTDFANGWFIASGGFSWRA
jgi:3'(2'), 5'-bisphosphate nucleotidase